MRPAALLPLVLACSGCNVILQPAGMIAEYTSNWRRVATVEDRERLHDWRSTFTASLDAARKAGHSADIDREGALLNPDAALNGPAIPNGMYRCRVIKLGAQSEGNLPYVSYPGFTCRVKPDHQLQRLGKLSGSQRYVGVLFPNDAIREAFLGTL